MTSHRHISLAKTTDKEANERLTILIPAAGMGRRMKSYGPKCLLDIGGITILERQIKILLKIYPGSDIIVISGFESDKVRKKIKAKYPVRIINNHRYKETNVLYSISLGLQASINRDFLIVYGDLVFSSKLIKGMCDEKSKVLIDKAGMFRKDEVGVTHNINEITNFSYGLNDKWSQIAYITGKELELFETAAFNEDCEKWFGYEALNFVINNGGKLAHVSTEGSKIVEVDSVKDIAKAIRVHYVSRV